MQVYVYHRWHISGKPRLLFLGKGQLTFWLKDSQWVIRWFGLSKNTVYCRPLRNTITFYSKVHYLWTTNTSFKLFQATLRSLLSEFEILTVTSLYIFEILCFIIKNRIYTTQYSDVHSYNAMYKHNLYVQHCNMNHCKSVINISLKIFIVFPWN
jgi:hypothetical protein